MYAACLQSSLPEDSSGGLLEKEQTNLLFFASLAVS